jgi:S1-C subfamily serine protease
VAHRLTPQLADAFGLDRKLEGLIVTDVVQGAPADRAGLQPGDIIYAIDGKKVSDAREMLMRISAHRPGDRMTLSVYREGKQLTLNAAAGERPEAVARTRVQ